MGLGFQGGCTAQKGVQFSLVTIPDMWVIKLKNSTNQKKIKYFHNWGLQAPKKVINSLIFIVILYGQSEEENIFWGFFGGVPHKF